MKVYVKKKPVGCGFKSYTLHDSENAHNCRLELHTGEAPQAGEHGIKHDIVMRLMAAYLQPDYHLFTDNYYALHALALSLMAELMGFVSTVNSNRHSFSQPDH